MAFKQRHIDGLKGIACLLIMLGHFSGLYKYAQNCSAIDAPSLQHIPYFFLAEGFWLRLFYVLSGYLVSRSRVPTARDLARKITTRFLRLALPLLGASFLILLLTAVFGLHTREIQSIVPNQWVAMSYSEPLTVTGVFVEPFRVLLFGKCVFNPVWWMLKSMFFASLLVYAISWGSSLFSSRQPDSGLAADLACLILILFFIFSGKDISFSVLIGALYGYSEKPLKKALARAGWVCWPMLLAPLAGYYVSNRLPGPAGLCSADAAFVCFLIAVDHLKFPNRVFSGLDKLGCISFGVYSLHWPVFCSAGLLMIIRGVGKMPGSRIYLISILVSALITAVLSILFHATVERWSGMVCKKVDRLFLRSREASAQGASCSKKS